MAWRLHSFSAQSHHPVCAVSFAGLAIPGGQGLWLALPLGLVGLAQIVLVSVCTGINDSAMTAAPPLPGRTWRWALGLPPCMLSTRPGIVSEWGNPPNGLLPEP